MYELIIPVVVVVVVVAVAVAAAVERRPTRALWLHSLSMTAHHLLSISEKNDCTKLKMSSVC